MIEKTNQTNQTNQPNQTNEPNQTKCFWYCMRHDDAFYTTKDHDLGRFSYSILCHCCTDREECEILYIGKMIIENGIKIHDTTPSEEWFSRRGGGFEKGYLDQCDCIDADVSDKSFSFD